MNLKNTVLIVVALCSSLSAFAQGVNDLFVIDEGKAVSCQQLLKDETDIQAIYGYENFCYQGNADLVLKKIDQYKKSGNFFSGGGGGFEYISGRVNRGFVSYDLQLEFADEVAEGETVTVIVKPCSFKIK